MRHGRAKATRKTLAFFQHAVGIKPPYYVLLDGTFLTHAMKFKIPLLERLDRLLQHAPCKLCTVASTLQELQNLAQAAAAAGGNNSDKAAIFQQAHAWAKQHCSEILPTAVQPQQQQQLQNNDNDCQGPSICDKVKWSRLSAAAKDLLLHVTGADPNHSEKNPSKKRKRDENEDDNEEQSTTTGSSSLPYHRQYFLASQDEELLDICRHVGSAPVIRLVNHSVLILEQPSKFADHKATVREKQKWSVAGSVQEQEKVLVDIVKEKERQERERIQLLEKQNALRKQGKLRPKKKAKAPNPLSCKKKNATTTGSSVNADEKKRKRRRKNNSESGAQSSNVA